MKLKILVAIFSFVILSAVKVNAQDLHLGVEGGFDTASLANSDASNIQGSFTGFVGGAFVGVGLGPLAIQPEVLYVQKGGQSLDGKSSFEFDYIEIPVLAKFSLGLPVIDPAILIGPYWSFNTSSHATNGTITNVNPNDAGGIVGLELNLGPISLSGRWELGLNHVTTDTNIQNRDFMFLAGISFI